MHSLTPGTSQPRRSGWFSRGILFAIAPVQVPEGLRRGADQRHEKINVHDARQCHFGPRSVDGMNRQVPGDIMTNETSATTHPLSIALQASCLKVPAAIKVGLESSVVADDRHSISAQRLSGPGLSLAPAPSPRLNSRWTRSVESAAPSDPLTGPAVVATILLLCGP